MFNWFSRALLLQRSVQPPGIGIQVTRSHTNRPIQVTADYYTAEKWASRRRWQLRWLAPAWRVRRALRTVNPAVGPELICFRGRKENPSIASWLDVGPPTTDAAADGRYNRQHTPALYLADSVEGVRLECSAPRLCVQEFRIDQRGLKLADLSSPLVPNVLAAAFDMAESSCVPRRAGRPDYAFSQLLATFVQKAGFDGMVVPGVRGTTSQRYRNIVVFRCADWRSWCCTSGFRRIEPTKDVTGQTISEA
jgi:RES domain-containing protein